MIDRRRFLTHAALFGAATALPRIAFAAAATEKRFVFIIQRGAADGLAIVPPVGDVAYAGLRGALTEQDTIKLDAMFALHGALGKTAALYRGGEALFAHAIASPYRDRSHFDGQNVLETGGTGPYRQRDGWLNRMLALLPAGEAEAIAVAATVPLALRGAREVSSYAPSALPDASDDLLRRVAALYESDAQLHALFGEAMETRSIVGDAAHDPARSGQATGMLAASLLAPDHGARVATIEMGGWDTHSGQHGRLDARLRELDALIDSLRTGLGGAWSDTVVLVATEFGRTAAANGTGGTDHGTGTAVMLVGGAVRGGRVIADWPGLTPAALYEGRDLRPTMALDAFIAGAVAAHYRIEAARTMTTLFPGSTGRVTEGLVRAI